MNDLEAYGTLWHPPQADQSNIELYENYTCQINNSGKISDSMG